MSLPITQCPPFDSCNFHDLNMSAHLGKILKLISDIMRAQIPKIVAGLRLLVLRVALRAGLTPCTTRLKSNS